MDLLPGTEIGKTVLLQYGVQAFVLLYFRTDNTEYDKWTSSDLKLWLVWMVA